MQQGIDDLNVLLILVVALGSLVVTALCTFAIVIGWARSQCADPRGAHDQASHESAENGHANYVCAGRRARFSITGISAIMVMASLARAFLDAYIPESEYPVDHQTRVLTGIEILVTVLGLVSTIAATYASAPHFTWPTTVLLFELAFNLGASASFLMPLLFWMTKNHIPASSALPVYFAVLQFVAFLTMFLTVWTSRRALLEWRRQVLVSDKGWREWRASLYQKFSFSWLDELIELASQRSLTDGDLWDLGDYDRGELIYVRFRQIMDFVGTKDGFVSLSLLKLIWKPLAFEWTISLVDSVLLFTNPLFIHNILGTIQNPSASHTDILYPVSGLLLVSLARTLCETQLYWINRHIDVKVRASIVGVLLEQSMRCLGQTGPPGQSQQSDSNKGKKKDGGKAKKDKGNKSGGDGLLTNLMSSDTEKILVCIRQSHYLLSIPVLFILCGSLLVSTVGIAGAIAGVLSLSAAVPATNFIGKVIKANRRSLLEKSDERMSKLSEVLVGMRTIKLQTWESFFHKSLTTTRDSELSALRYYLTATIGTQLLWRGSPLFASITTFLARVASEFIRGNSDVGSVVDPAVAFTVLAMYNNVLRYPILVIPKLYIAFMEARVSLSRIEDFLRSSELERYSPRDGVGDYGGLVGFSCHASFAFGGATQGSAALRDETTPLLAGDGGRSPATAIIRDLDFLIPKGKITVVIGPTGSGKSSLLRALLGEMTTLNGAAHSPIIDARVGKSSIVGYAAQSPWIQNATIRDNILCGSPFDESRYAAVLSACALDHDLAGLVAGDMTEVGDRGSTLSGGQKQRIGLARAVYSDSDLLLLDDVLSAVDAQTAQHILSQCVMGEVCRRRTRVLVTNAVDLALQHAHFVVVMKGDGTVAATGSVAEVMIKANSNDAIKIALSNAGVTDSTASTLSSSSSVVAATVTEATATEKEQQEVSVKRVTKDESTGADHVGLSTYAYYFRSAGGWFPFLLLMSTILAAYGMGFLHDYFLKEWAEAGSGEYAARDARLSLIVYVCAGFLALLSLYIRYRSQIYVSTRASAQIHSAALGRLLDAPMEFFETTPSGRIMNRFGKDLSTVDLEVVNSIGETLQQAAHAAVVALMIGIVSPVLAVAAVPIALMYVPLTRKFLALNRSLKRLEVVTRSPIYQSFGETTAGISTIRALNQESRQVRQVLRRVDSNHRAFLLMWAANRWLAFRVEVIGSLVTFAAGVAIAAGRSGLGGGVLLPIMDAGWSGLCLNYASMFTDVLTWLVRNSATMEMTMTSVERLQEYSDSLPTESSATTIIRQAPPNWPTHGRIQIQDLMVRYTNDAPPALRIPGKLYIGDGERVAVVGRTGSGKTTLGAVFARLREPSDGTVLIDGVDIRDLGLKYLRNGVTVVPQDAFLFRASLRDNVDPLREHSDADVTSALALVNLVAAGFGLDSVVAEGGGNMPLGQRQLVSLCRAILRGYSRTQGVLILDEATASLDLRADETAHQVLQQVFHGRWTVLTIAHRLRSVAAADRVLVMSEGEVVQDGRPRDLVAMGEGAFWDLCVQSGELEDLRRLFASSL